MPDAAGALQRVRAAAPQAQQPSPNLSVLRVVRVAPGAPSTAPKPDANFILNAVTQASTGDIRCVFTEG